MSGRASLGGMSTDAAAARNTTPRDPHPLPSGSILSDYGFPTADNPGRVPIFIASIGFAVPLILAGVMLRFG